MGIKPSLGLTSRNLVIPISEHQDTVGPMARSVKDAAYLLQAIAGVDPNDNYTSAIPGDIPDYVAACDPAALKGARIGIVTNVVDQFNREIEKSAYFDAIEVLKGAGAEIIDGANFTAYDDYLADEGTVNILYADFVANLRSYLSELDSNPNEVVDLAGVTEFTQSFEAEEYPDRDTAVFDESLELDFDNTSPEFWEQYQKNLFYGGEGGLFGAIDRNQLDAVILPTSTAAGVAAVVGAPVVTVPLGFYPQDAEVERTPRNLVSTGPNVPYGLAFLGKRFSEESLIGYAYAFEQLTNVRNKVQPQIVPKTEVCDISKSC